MKLIESTVTLTEAQQSLYEEIQRLETNRKKINAAIQHAKKTCSDHLFSVEEKYYEGSYNDTASTVYTNVCIICGKRETLKEVSHGYYG